MKNSLLTILILVSISAATSVNATIIDFDAASVGTFFTSPLSEDGYTFTVNSGHYDIIGGPSGNAFNLDDVTGLASVTLTRDGGGLFDAVNFFMVSPATTGAFSIMAVGNTGDIFAPTSVGLFELGAGFTGISALTISQNSTSFFAIDDLTLRERNAILPAPATLVLLSLGLAGLGWIRRRIA